ncbi:TPA: hypothetical protein ORR86_004325 [Escherichia coli]|nr:hypothetical protein [Escherichia coli]
MDALERFFHKLEFLLKEGYLPSTEDIYEGGRLPPELRGLKAFLEKGKTEGSYVLQRNDMERYRFSWQSSEKLTVTVENFHVSIAAVRSGYNNRSTAGWRAQTTPQECGVSGLLSLLKEVPYNKSQWMSYEDFDIHGRGIVYSRTSNQHLIAMNINNDASKDDFLKAYKQVVKKVSDRPCSCFIPASHSDNEPIFNTCLVDIRRADKNPLSLGGVEISENMFKEIISRIMPDYESKASSVVNTSAFTTEDVERILTSSDIAPDKKETISDILRHPQFPLALLAVVCQGLSAGGVMEPLRTCKENATAILDDNKINCIADSDLTLYSFSIKSDEKEGLLCENTVYMPYPVGEDKIGVSKACNKFSVTENLGIGKTEHSASEIKDMLATLNSAISTAITI